jgi:hypothetical protein
LNKLALFVNKEMAIWVCKEFFANDGSAWPSNQKAFHFILDRFSSTKYGHLGFLAGDVAPRIENIGFPADR